MENSIGSVVIEILFFFTKLKKLLKMYNILKTNILSIKEIIPFKT